MKLLLTSELMYSLVKMEASVELEKFVIKELQKNSRIYISILTVREIMTSNLDFDREIFLEKIQTLCDEVLPFNLEIFKLESSLVKSGSKLHYLEAATAAFYGLDRLVVPKPPFSVPIIGIGLESK